MKNSKTRSTGGTSLLKGHRHAGKPVTEVPGGRMSLGEDAATDSLLLHVGEDLVLGVHRSVLEVLRQDDVVALDDGSFRVSIVPSTLHLRMGADELNSLLSLRRSAGATPTFEGAATAVGATAATEQATPAKSAGKTARKGKAAKPAKAAKAKTPKLKATKAPTATTEAAAETQPTAAKRGRKATKPATTGSEAPVVSLAERRLRKQGSAKAGQATQTELPGLGAPSEVEQPLRKAARSANTVRRLREPLPTGEAATRATPAGKGGRRKASAETVPGTRGKATKAGSNARGAVKGTAGKQTRGKASLATETTATTQAASTDVGSTETTKKAPGRKAGTKNGKATAGKATTAKTTAPKARGGRTATPTAQVSGEAASVVEVKAAARSVIMSEGRPLPRRELLNLVQAELKRPVPGKDPIENLATILYKDKDKGFTLVKGRGFWVAGQDLPQA